MLDEAHAIERGPLPRDGVIQRENGAFDYDTRWLLLFFLFFVLAPPRTCLLCHGKTLFQLREQSRAFGEKDGGIWIFCMADEQRRAALPVSGEDVDITDAVSSGIALSVSC